MKKERRKKTDQEVLSLILTAIVNNRDFDIASPMVEVLFSKKNGLFDIDSNQITSILESLQNIHKVIRNLDVCYPNTIKAKHNGEILDKENTRASFILLRGFDNWYSAYLLSIDTQLKDISRINIERIYSAIMDISEIIELKPSSCIELDVFSSNNPDMLEDQTHGQSESYKNRDAALTFLQNKAIVRKFKYIFSEYGSHFDVDLDIDNFLQFKTEIENYYEKTYLGIEASRIKFPDNLVWEDISIHFIDGHNVKISARNKTFKVNFKDMGFMDKRTLKPNTQWQLLEAIAAHAGEVSWGASIAEPKIKKRKSKLAKTLRNFFNIADDPFFPYENANSYALRIRFS